MSLDKAILYNKEHRKAYRGSKAFDLHCRDGRCPTCVQNDLYNNKKRILIANSKLQEIGNDD